VWKTTDGGFLWNNVSDGYFKRGSVGAIAVSCSSPETLYVGMGECSTIHGQTHGDGVYRSDDGGRSWRHLGLAETHSIGRIRIHPTNPDIAWIAAWGHRFGPNRERGVFRTTDGGNTWEHVLFRSEKAGAIDITVDQRNPNFMYAAFWEGFARPWTYSSGGPDSSIYKSVDGGDSWTDITHNPGLPQGLLGKIGIAISPARPDRVYALIEAEEGGVYRSDDGGLTWSWMDNNRSFTVRASYFCHIVADASDPDAVYLPNRKLWKSVDGGRSFRQLNSPYVDQHDLWVDPVNSQRMILGSDGGASVSFNGGVSWSPLLNQPTAEIYHLAADNHFPYRIYGSQQDNSTIAIPSRSERGPISMLEYYDVGGGESGFIAVRADDPNIVYSSDLPGLGVTRYDHRTFQLREIAPWAEPDSWDIRKLKYRFNWAYPVVLSPHDPNILYVAANVLFRTTNEGESWQIISPDLTKDDPTTMMPAGGPIQRENSAATQYGNITSVAESPAERGVIWVGTSDGWVHVTRDDGKTWQNVTPPGYPEWALSQVEPSSNTPGKAYVAASDHYMDNFAPLLYKTEDYGATWSLISGNIPAGCFLRVVREDPVCEGLLFAGTEAGVFFSMDDGAHWQALQSNLPVTPIYDLLVKENDLVAATHGRSMWILDDISPLRLMKPAIADEPAYLFRPQAVYRITRAAYGLDSLMALYYSYSANNPPNGIVVYYHFKETPEARVTIALLDMADSEISSFSSDIPEVKPRAVGPYAYRLRGGSVALSTRPAGEPEMGVKWGPLTLDAEPGTVVPARVGLNRFVVPIQHRGANIMLGLLRHGITAPLLVPGNYQVRLTVGEESWTQVVAVVQDPRVSTTLEAYEAQYDLMVQIRDAVTDVHSVGRDCRNLRRVIADMVRLLQNDPQVENAALARNGRALVNALTEIDGALIKALTEESGELEGSHSPPALDAKLQSLGFKVARSDNAPTRQMYDMYEELVQRVDEQYERFWTIVEHDIPEFNVGFDQTQHPRFQLPTTRPTARHIRSRI